MLLRGGALSRIGLVAFLGGGGLGACSLLTDTDGLGGGGGGAPLEGGAGSDAPALRPDGDTAGDGNVSNPDDAGAGPTTELIAEYLFDETSGTVVHDRIAPALDLSLPVSGTSWNGGLVVDTSSVIASGPTTKIHDRVLAAGAFSVEVWVEPANTTQAMPARIVALSPGPTSSTLTFMVGQEATAFALRTRSHFGDEIQGGTATTSRHQVVAVSRLDGQRKLLVDARLAALDILSGPLTIAPAETPLVLANEPTGDRPWLGRFLGLSIFAGALSDEEIAQRFQRGPP